MGQHLFSLKFERSNSFSSLHTWYPSQQLNAGTSQPQKDNECCIPPCYFTIRKHAFFSCSKYTGIISICLASLFWRWFTSFNYFSLSSSKHIWMPRTLIKQLCQKWCLNSPKPERTSVDCNLNQRWHKEWVCIFPCLGHHLLGPSQITHVGMPEYSCGQYHPFLNLRHGISISKRILWNNIKSPLPLGTVIPGFVQSSRWHEERVLLHFRYPNSPLQGSLPEKFRGQLCWKLL